MDNMLMSAPPLGDQTLRFVTVTDSGVPGWGGIRPKVTTETAVTGCQFRPLSTTETIALGGDVSTEMWQGTVRPVPAVLAAKPNSAVKHNGVEYQLHGHVQPKYFGPNIHYVNILCKRQAG